MAVDRRAQVVHHRLADEVREERLPDAEHARSRSGSRPSRRRAPSADCMSTVASPVSGSTWIAVSSTSRSRNGGTTPSAAETTISPETSASRALVRPEQPDDPAEVRLPDGRVGGALGRHRSSRSFPPPTGHQSSVPAGRVSASEAIAARTRSGRARVRLAIVGGAALDRDRLADDDPHPRAARNACSRPQSAVGADDPHGHERRARGQSASRAAPRSQGTVVAAEHRALREDRHGRHPREARPSPRPAPRGRRARAAPGSHRAVEELADDAGSPTAPPSRRSAADDRARCRGRTDRASESWFETTISGPAAGLRSSGRAPRSGPGSQAPSTARVDRGTPSPLLAPRSARRTGRAPVHRPAHPRPPAREAHELAPSGSAPLRRAARDRAARTSLRPRAPCPRRTQPASSPGSPPGSRAAICPTRRGRRRAACPRARRASSAPGSTARDRARPSTAG